MVNSAGLIGQVRSTAQPIVPRHGTTRHGWSWACAGTTRWLASAVTGPSVEHGGPARHGHSPIISKARLGPIIYFSML
jgi:hypothetical protein